MANNFKSDDSFLRKLVVGAAGTNATIDRLHALGFKPIELERGSTGYKIWKRIKIKRVRVPDILCLDTGLRVESRGKTKLEISMSHSLSDPQRQWDAGMRDDDLVSIVEFHQAEDVPVEVAQSSPVHFISIRDLRETFRLGQVELTMPKGVEEGSERRLQWICATASVRSEVAEIGDGRLSLVPVGGGRRQSIQLQRKKGQFQLLPQVRLGEVVEANQIVASVVAVRTAIAPAAPVDERFYINRLRNVNLSERYAAAKALRYRGFLAAEGELVARLADPDEDIYVKLEAAAALAAHGHEAGWEFIESKVRVQVEPVPLETQLESIIVASEIPGTRSEALLIEVLQDAGRDDELRAGAAWALGQHTTPIAADALASTFAASPIEIRVEAARALLRMATTQVPHLVEQFRDGGPAMRDGIAWVLARVNGVSPGELLRGADDDMRRWASYILGTGKENFVENEVVAICASNPDVYFAASVLWQMLASWTNGLREY